MVDRAQELCESRGGRPGLPVPNKPTVSVDVKQHFNQGQGGGRDAVASVRFPVEFYDRPSRMLARACKVSAGTTTTINMVFLDCVQHAPVTSSPGDSVKRNELRRHKRH